MDISTLRTRLLDPGIYPDRPEVVGFAETHISLVFLAGSTVYKVKKPVDFGFLDFTSLEKRRYFCEREVVLNRRLAPDFYLGVTRITEDRGLVFLDGPGEVVEYAVKMKRIPDELLLSRLLEKNQVTPEMVEAVARRLVRFYSAAETNELISKFARPERIKQDTDENFEQTDRYVGMTLDRTAYEAIRNRTNRFLLEEKEVFHDRIVSGRVRDCHGDLRLEHIVWGEEIAIFDCIEFNERFRYIDIAADMAFLAMDLDFRGREGLAGHFIRAYADCSGDESVFRILDFYKCYRAYVRGKVESFRLDDPHMPEGEKEEAAKRARRYFDLADRYAGRF